MSVGGSPVLGGSAGDGHAVRLAVRRQSLQFSCALHCEQLGSHGGVVTRGKRRALELESGGTQLVSGRSAYKLVGKAGGAEGTHASWLEGGAGGPRNASGKVMSGGPGIKRMRGVVYGSILKAKEMRERRAVTRPGRGEHTGESRGAKAEVRRTAVDTAHRRRMCLGICPSWGNGTRCENVGRSARTWRVRRPTCL